MPRHLRLPHIAILTLGIACGAFAASAPSPITPQQAEAAITEGNQRYAGGAPLHPRQDAARRTEQAKGQTPFAVVLSCSDSRVPVETIFDQGVGDLFVVRVAGNVARGDEIGSVEYGVDHLGAPLLVVLGHESCGAVKAVAEGAAVHGHIPDLVAPIADPVAAVRAKNPALSGPDFVHAAVEANAHHSLATLLRDSHAVAARVRDGRLRAIAAVYDLETGAVRWLGAHPEQSRILNEAAAGAPSHHGQTSEAHAASAPHTESHATAPTGHATEADASLPWHIPAIGAAMLAALLFAAHRYSLHGMTGWTVGRRLAAGFALVLLVLLGLGIESYVAIHHGLKDFKDFKADSATGETASVMLVDYRNMELALKDIVLRRDAAPWTKYESARADLSVQIRRLEAGLDDQALVAGLRKIEQELGSLHSLAQEIRDSVRQPAKLMELSGRLPPISERVEAELDTIDDAILAHTHATGETLTADLALTQAKIVWIAIASIFLGSGLAFIIARSIVRPLLELGSELGAGAEQTVSAAGQVSASSQSLAEGASEQAASMEESSASLEELNAMTKRNAESSASAKQTASSARASASEGESQIRAMRSAMEDIQTASREITAIVKTIDEIAFQTNILALNAAVEAARAGEHGAGFAIVADEVRALAQRSAQAARETSERIAASVEKSRHGSEISGHVSEHFARIQADIVRLDTLVGEITTASTEQSQGIGQPTQAISQIDHVTQTNAAAAEECAAAAEELHSQGQMLLGAVTSLRKLTGGAGAAVRASSPAAASPASRIARQPAPAAPHKPATPAVRPSRAETTTGDFFK